MITMIPRSKLEPHPDNPRKDLGDLTELAASIERSGLLQNLTVVPHPDKPDMYRIIIGHRRFAASEIAGVDELPCSIEDMDEATQIATMLAENMQRNDLTICDQVFGVQCMMNLGEDANGIAVKTGLSSTTIRKRMKLTHLDPKGLEQAEQRGATLLDLAKVADLEDQTAREKVLATVATANFNYELKKARDEQKARKLVPAALNLMPWARPMPREEWLKAVRAFDIVRYVYVDGKDPDYSKPDNAEGMDYIAVYTMYSTQICVYRLYSDEENAKREAEDAAKRANMQEHQNACAEMRQRTRELREQFFRDKFNGQNVDAEAVYEMAVEAICMSDFYSSIDCGTPNNIMQSKPDKGIIRAAVFAWYKLESNRPLDYAGWNSQYEGNPQLDKIYGFLERLGYQISDAERSWMNGTHPCFAKGAS